MHSTTNQAGASALHLQYFDSPIGLIVISANEQAIVSVLFTEEAGTPEISSPLTRDCARQLEDFFRGKRQAFDLPLQPVGTNFQMEVWNELQKIPFGTTISYKSLAARLGNEKKIRAAGTANGKNPVSIIIPCHRVIGSNGELVGYGGGLWRKKWLLEMEIKSRQAEIGY
jgi:methylated-DNA-[protein]-cysteine S-methyltransferase